jgi:DnaA regulatory inactivator Hda
MTTPRQIPLDLGYRPAVGRDDFFVAPGNADAVAWIDRWPQWPAHALALFGPAGCGKTHLAHVFAARASAKVMAIKDINAASLAAVVDSTRAIVLEYSDTPFDELAVFHLYNALQQTNGWLLFTGRDAPARWAVTLPDLKSRLSSLQAVRIEPPDDDTMQAVLVKLFADRQINVGPDVIAYLSRHMERTFAQARQIVELADRESLAGQRAVTIPLIKSLLEPKLL